MPRLNTAYVLITLSLLLTACQSPHSVYESKQNCLSSVIADCKQRGWDFVRNDPVCQRAANEGIYGLSYNQLMTCRAAEEQAKKSR